MDISPTMSFQKKRLTALGKTIARRQGIVSHWSEAVTAVAGLAGFGATAHAPRTVLSQWGPSATGAWLIAGTTRQARTS